MSQTTINSSFLDSYAQLTTRNRRHIRHNKVSSLKKEAFVNRNDEQSWSISEFVYILALHLLTLSVAVYRRVRIIILQCIYSIRLRSIGDATQVLDVAMPGHVLVILNENIQNDKQIYCLFDSIISFFNQNNSKESTREITFYQFDVATDSSTVFNSIRDQLSDKYKCINPFFNFFFFGLLEYINSFVNL